MKGRRPDITIRVNGIKNVSRETSLCEGELYEYINAEKGHFKFK